MNGWKTSLRILQVAMAFYALATFFTVGQCAVDIPYWDEWSLFTQGRMGGNVLGSWIFERHNEHRVMPTHLSLIANYYLFGLNFRYQIIFNYILFLTGFFFLWRFLDKGMRSDFHRFCLLMAFLPALSNLAAFVHMMAGQNCLHFLLISLIAGTYLFFFKKTKTGFLGGIALWILCVFSYGAGPGAVIGGVLVWGVSQWVYDRKILYRKEVPIGLAALALALVFFLFNAPPPCPPSALSESFLCKIHFIRFQFS